MKKSFTEMQQIEELIRDAEDIQELKTVLISIFWDAFFYSQPDDDDI